MPFKSGTRRGGADSRTAMAVSRRNVSFSVYKEEKSKHCLYIVHPRSISGLSSLSDETLNQGPMTVFQENLLTRTYCDEAGDYIVPNVLSPRGL